MAKKKKGRSDAATTRNMQANVNRRMRDALAMSGGASAGIREGMDYGRFPGTAGDRLETERSAARDAARMRSPATQARRTENQALAEDRTNRRKEGGAMKSKKSKAPTTSTRPTPNPRRSDPVSRGNAASRRQQSEQDDVLKNGGRGMKAGGKVKKMMNGGKCRGMGAATKGGNYSRG